MKKRLVIILSVFVVTSFPCVAHAYGRIVSLKPNITEILFALGAGDRVVGVTKYCDYPDAAKKIPRVADYVKPFTERIISLSPDLIVGSWENGSRKSIETLEGLGFKVALFKFTNLEETLKSIRDIGSLIGEPERAKKIVDDIKGKFEAVGKRHDLETRPKALIACGRRPLVVAGAGTFMDELIKIAGATNVASRGDARYPRWSAEQVIAANPDVIIDMTMGSEADTKNAWSDLSMVNAVKNGRIYRLDDSLFRAGPRLTQAIDELEKAVYEKKSL